MSAKHLLDMNYKLSSSTSLCKNYENLSLGLKNKSCTGKSKVHNEEILYEISKERMSNEDTGAVGGSNENKQKSSEDSTTGIRKLSFMNNAERRNKVQIKLADIFMRKRSVKELASNFESAQETNNNTEIENYRKNFTQETETQNKNILKDGFDSNLFLSMESEHKKYDEENKPDGIYKTQTHDKDISYKKFEERVSNEDIKTLTETNEDVQLRKSSANKKTSFVNNAESRLRNIKMRQRRRTGILMKEKSVKEIANNFESFREANYNGKIENYRQNILEEMDKENERMLNDGFDSNLCLSMVNLSNEDVHYDEHYVQDEKLRDIKGIYKTQTHDKDISYKKFEERVSNEDIKTLTESNEHAQFRKCSANKKTSFVNNAESRLRNIKTRQRRRTGILMKEKSVKEIANNFEGFREAKYNGKIENYRQNILKEMDKENERMLNDGFDSNLYLSIANLSNEDVHYDEHYVQDEKLRDIEGKQTEENYEKYEDQLVACTSNLQKSNLEFNITENENEKGFSDQIDIFYENVSVFNGGSESNNLNITEGGKDDNFSGQMKDIYGNISAVSDYSESVNLNIIEREKEEEFSDQTEHMYENDSVFSGGFESNHLKRNSISSASTAEYIECWMNRKKSEAYDKDDEKLVNFTAEENEEDFSDQSEPIYENILGFSSGSKSNNVNLTETEKEEDSDEMEHIYEHVSYGGSESNNFETSSTYSTTSAESIEYWMDRKNSEPHNNIYDELPACSSNLSKSTPNFNSTTIKESESNMENIYENMLVFSGVSESNDIEKSRRCSTKSTKSMGYRIKEERQERHDTSPSKRYRRSDPIKDEKDIVRIDRVPYSENSVSQEANVSNFKHNEIIIREAEESSNNTMSFQYSERESQITNTSTAEKKGIKYILEEILKTEITYVYGIESLFRDYYGFLHEHSPEKVNIIFGNIGKIYKLQVNFLRTLERHSSELDKITRAFIDYEELFKLYPKYMRNASKSNAAVESLHDILKKRQEELNNILNISAYLITPVQRLGRYTLFFENIIKALNKDNLPTKQAELALGIVRKYMREGDDAVVIDSIEGSPIDSQDYGTFITKDKFTLLKPKRLDSTVYLFENIIVFTIEYRKDRFTYYKSILTNNLGMGTSSENHIRLIDYEKKRCLRTRAEIVLEAKSSEIEYKWTHEIQKILWNQLHKVKAKFLTDYYNKPHTETQRKDEMKNSVKENTDNKKDINPGNSRFYLLM
ncbi:hypothetical protein GWI33_003448 [Rhynchophorus ferrugineus]|uniref:DH domain-containing protein n=1 Tax=Rhynchophorus ferrugineus TaxID=354439 RepID=A0A834IXD5_RHYFE|nr:hypothetical protein GWI33_003448 [Rhynchophorus ferrugineus]